MKAYARVEVPTEREPKNKRVLVHDGIEGHEWQLAALLPPDMPFAKFSETVIVEAMIVAQRTNPMITRAVWGWPPFWTKS